MNQSYADIQTEQTENVWSLNLPGTFLCFPEKAWKILLSEYSAADPVGDTERGAALLEGRIFFSWAKHSALLCGCGLGFP